MVVPFLPRVRAAEQPWAATELDSSPAHTGRGDQAAHRQLRNKVAIHSLIMQNWPINTWIISPALHIMSLYDGSLNSIHIYTYISGGGGGLCRFFKLHISINSRPGVSSLIRHASRCLLFLLGIWMLNCAYKKKQCLSWHFISQHSIPA